MVLPFQLSLPARRRIGFRQAFTTDIDAVAIERLQVSFDRLALRLEEGRQRQPLAQAVEGLVHGEAGVVSRDLEQVAARLPEIERTEIVALDFPGIRNPELRQYEKRWAPGTRERLAFALLLYTGQRRSDVARMSWRDIEGNGIWVRQRKTKEKLLVPLHTRLKALLDEWPRTHVMLLVTANGEPFSKAGFGNWLADKIEDAGLPDECVPHGHRKAAARRLAEAGCSVHEIASVTGHRTLAEVQRYTKEADQQRLSQAAMKRLGD